MATVRKRTLPSGKIVWQADFRDQHGKRRQPQFDRRKEADAALVANRAKVAAGTYSPDASSVTLGDAFDLLLARATAEKVERHTLVVYRSEFAHNQIYVGMALRKPGTHPGKRTGKADYGSHFCWADDAADWSVVRARTADCPADLITCTGTDPTWRGQLVWRFQDPITDPDRLEAINAGIGQRLDGDDVFNRDRLLRLAGTVNWPLKPGRTKPEVVTIQWTNGEWSSTDPLLAWKVYAKVPNGAAEPSATYKDIFDRVSFKKALTAAQKPGKWHEVVRGVVASLVKRGTPDDIVQLACLVFTQTGYTHDQTQADVAKMLRGARAKWGEHTFDQVDRKPEAKPSIVALDLSEFLAMKFTPSENVLGPWLRVKTLAMLFGPRGEGKSSLLLGAIRAIITGGKFLDWEAPKPRKVLLIDGELPGSMLQDRVQDLVVKGLDPETVNSFFRIVTPDAQLAGLILSLNSAEDQTRVAEFIAWADVIVLDNLACLTGGDENDREAWLPMQAWILRLRMMEKTVLMIHHGGKGGDQRGTSSREDVLDTVVKLKKPADYDDRQGLRVEWYFTKHRSFYGDDAVALEIMLENDGAAGKRWKWQKLDDSLIEQVVELLKDKSMSTRDIAQDMGISKSKVHRLKMKAKSMGKIK